ncbi:MAG: HAD family phosphatase, partial [Thomasclavelia ramosa]|nr:HAD family phosphatase [Thomasclavelia ramosa]
MIKNIVFDMGNVILRWDPHYIASKLSNDSLEQEVIERELFASKQWQKLDQGLLTVEEALKELKTDNPQLIRHALLHWYDYFEPFAEMVALVKELKEQGYHIYLLSNCSLQFDDYYQNIEAFKYFDDFYISARYQLLKPDLEIFKHFLSKFNLKAEECIFIDDIKANVEGAKIAKMHGYQ